MQKFRRQSLQLCVTSMVFFCALVLFLGWQKSDLVTPDASILLLDANDQFLAEFESVNAQGEGIGFGYWPIEAIEAPANDQLSMTPRTDSNVHAQQKFLEATLALEDRHFWSHYGVDFGAIVRAFKQNIQSGKRISGASTIAMQVVRAQRPAPRTYFNKLVEASAAMMMTARYGRAAVLRQYLQWVPYGNRIHGASYAARRYFNKTVADLSWAEVALLAAVPQSPTRMNPVKFFGRKQAVKRGKKILHQLNEQGLIDSVQYQWALQQIVQLTPPRPATRPVKAMHAILQIEKQIRTQALAFDQPLIRTSFDLSMQYRLQAAVNDKLPWWRYKGAGNTAVMVIDRQKNQIKAWLGSADYFDKPHLGSIDYTQIARSPGSTLKPFVFAQALQSNIINGASVIDDLPDAQSLVRNSDYRFLGPMLPRQALANSRNVPAIHLVNEMGLNTVFSLFSRLGLHQHQYPASHYGAAMTLGSMPVTLEQLVNAYSVFAPLGEDHQSGVYQAASWFDSISHPKIPVFDATTTDQITLYLSDPQARLPSFPRMGTSEFDFDAAVKTGTSQNYKDAWTVAYSNEYLVATWVGHANDRAMNGLNGSGSAADLTQTILSDLHKHQKPAGFGTPLGFENVTLCTLSGHIATELCPTQLEEWLAKKDIPKQHDRSIQRVWRDKKTGKLANELTPKADKVAQLMMNLPPRYDLWLSQQGQLDDHNAVGAASPTLANSIQLLITSPKNHAHILANPEMPSDAQFVQLTATVTPRIEQVIWYVNDEPWQLAEFPYQVNLPIQSGHYRIQVGVPNSSERSDTLSLLMQ